MEELFLYFTFVYDWINVLQLIAVSFSVVLVLGRISFTRKGVCLFVGNVVLVFAGETFLNWMLFYISHFISFLTGINFPLAHLITIALYACFVSRYNGRSRIVLAATVFVTAIAMAELGTQCMRYFAFVGNASKLFAVAADLLIIAFAVVISLRSIHNYENIPKISVGIILTVAIASTAVIVGAEIMSVGSHMESNLSTCLILLYVYLVTVSVYIVTYHHCTEHNAKMMLEVDKKLMQADIKMLSLSEQIAEDMRGLRHDIKNQFAMLNLLLENQQYDELKKYLSKYQSEYSKVKSLIQCGNQVIDNILNIEINKCITNNIKLQQEILVPSELNINPIDLCSLLSNIIDNSIDAVVKLTENQKIITLKIKYINDYLIITATNPTNKEFTSKELSSIKTTKSDKENHGYGLKIIQAICKKYNGHFELNYQNHNFIVSIMIECKGEANEKGN